MVMVLGDNVGELLGLIWRVGGLGVDVLRRDGVDVEEYIL